MLFELLALKFGIPPTDAFALLAQPRDVRTAVPDEKRFRIQTKARVALPPVGFNAFKKLDDEGFCFVS